MVEQTQTYALLVISHIGTLVLRWSMVISREKLDFMQPVLERVTHFHGRIAPPALFKPDITGKEDSTYVQHFCAIWQRTFNAFQKNAAANAKPVFAPELLFPSIYYAPVGADGQEIGDRWADALTMCQLCQSCWESAAAIPAPNIHYRCK